MRSLRHRDVAQVAKFLLGILSPLERVPAVARSLLLVEIHLDAGERGPDALHHLFGQVVVVQVQLLQVAERLPGDQRGAYLDRACAGDVALRRQVEALLNRCAECLITIFNGLDLTDRLRNSTGFSTHLLKSAAEGCGIAP